MFSLLLPVGQVQFYIGVVGVIKLGCRVHRPSRLRRLFDRDGRPTLEIVWLIRCVVRYDGHFRIRDMVQPIHGETVGAFLYKNVGDDLIVCSFSRPAFREDPPSQRIVVPDFRQIGQLPAAQTGLSFASSPFRIASGRSRAEATS